MREVDARGLSCPEPLMLTAEAIKSDNSPVKVLVTEPHQKTNVEKFAKDHGKKTTIEEIEDLSLIHISNSRRNRRWICCCDRVK